MGYPNPPTFRSADRNSAWWAVQQGATTRFCATQGMSFFRRLVRKLNNLRGQTGAAEIPANVLWWDAQIGNALVALARRINQDDTTGGNLGWRAVADALDANVRARRVTQQDMRFAVWVAYLQGTANTMEQIAFDARTVFPTWGGVPGDDAQFLMPDYGAYCWNQGEAAPPTGTPTSLPGGDPRPGEQTVNPGDLGNAPNLAPRPSRAGLYAAGVAVGALIAGGIWASRR